jgi:hypothetical protein
MTNFTNIISFRIGFILGVLMLLNSIAYSQSKKKQIEQLNLRIDSLNKVVQIQLSEQNISLKSFENDKIKLENRIDSLKQEVSRFEKIATEGERKNAEINSVIQKLKLEIQVQWDSLKIVLQENEILKNKISSASTFEYENNYFENEVNRNKNTINNGKLIILRGECVGMDNYMEIYSENYNTWSPDLQEIHIIPASNMFYNNDTISDQMTCFYPYFEFRDTNFRKFSGRVKVFYDLERTNLLLSVDIHETKFQGRLKMYKPDRTLYIDHEYDKGTLVTMRKDLSEWNWSFDVKNSNLNLPLNSEFISFDLDNNPIIQLGTSIHDKMSQNSLFEMLQKPVYKRPFTVNNKLFTGTIEGFFSSASLEKQPYFTLKLKNGKLHGIIKIYGSISSESFLILEERFENGVLIETIYNTEGEGMAKPVIYLYPTEKQDIHVKLKLKGTMTHSYPSYPAEGWKVNASPNGTLLDQNGQEYYALFWEGTNLNDFTYQEGFVIEGSETVNFLEKSLAQLGLNRREANEFIMYWLPQMENNSYNLIHFSTSEYEAEAKLEITPSPETLIRVMMVWSPLTKKIDIRQQELNKLAKQRNGFTAVEWGGKKQIFSLGDDSKK